MHDLLITLEPEDYRFLVEVLESSVNLTDGPRLRRLLHVVEEVDVAESRESLVRALEHEVRYAGSSELAYALRYATGQEPGVSFREIVRDVARTVKVSIDPLATEPEMLATLVQRYASRQFTDLPPEEQQALLEQLGVERDRAAAFLKKSAGVFAIPALVQAFGTLVVDGLIKTVIFGTIARIVGRQLASRLFSMLVARFPWWLGWIAPAAWTLSIGWAVLDLQGPAYRKTVPVVLYLGLCVLRDRTPERRDPRD